MAVFAHPRTIVQKGGKARDVMRWNATLVQAMVDIGVGVELCARRSGNQKGSVERLLGRVKSSFFKPRKFQDERDMEAQCAAWVIEVNTKTPSRATNVIPETRHIEELPRLRPVKVFPETMVLRVPIFVGPTAEALYDGVPYTMAPEATHIAGTLFIYQDRVRIVAACFDFESEQRRRKMGDHFRSQPAETIALVPARSWPGVAGMRLMDRAPALTTEP